MEEKQGSELITENPQDTQELAITIAQRIISENGPSVFTLYGDLGSGKTTFVQGLAKGLGVEQRIISPTFVIVRSYLLNPNNVIPNSFRDLKEKKMLKQVQHDNSRQARTIKYFYHIDLYRIETSKDLAGLGLEEILDNKQNIVAIEWAEKMGELLPERRVDVRFEHLDEEKRRIKWKKM